MNRVGEGFGFAERAQAALEQAQLETRRVAELARAQALAAEARALTAPAQTAVDPAADTRPENVGRVLGEVIGMLPEARQVFAERLAAESAARSGLEPAGVDPKAVVAHLVDDVCPPGTELRRRLGAALLERVGVASRGLGEKALETVVARALESFGSAGAAGLAAIAARPPASDAGLADRLERAAASRLGAEALRERPLTSPPGGAPLTERLDRGGVPNAPRTPPAQPGSVAGPAGSGAEPAASLSATAVRRAAPDDSLAAALQATTGSFALPAGVQTLAGGPPAAGGSLPSGPAAPAGGATALNASLAPAPRTPADVQRMAASVPLGAAWTDPRQEARRIEEATADLRALSQALGGAPVAEAVEPAPVIAAAALDATTTPAVESRPVAARLLGIDHMCWARQSDVVLGERLASVQGSVAELAERTDTVRQALLDAQSRRASVRVGFEQAAGHLESMGRGLEVASWLSRVRADPRQSLRVVAAARAAVADAGIEADLAIERLSTLKVGGLPQAVAEIRDIARQSRSQESELRACYGRGAMLEEIEAGAGQLAEAGAGPEPSAAIAPEGPGVLTEDDLARIGAGLDPSKPPAQGVWAEGMVNTVCELGRQQGGVTDADGARHLELARMLLGHEGADLAGPAGELAAGDLAAALKMAGVPLEKVDPNQLAAAARYVSTASSLTDQQDKLRKALDNFQVLTSVGPPRLPRQRMVDELWAMAMVPGHALQKLSDAELGKKFQEVAAALNGGPGPTEIKVGSHNLKLEVAEGGEVLSTSCKKPGFFSKVWSGIKTVAPIVLTVASFIPVTAPFARAIQGAIALYNAIKSKSMLAMATAAASVVGAGAAIARGASQVVGTVERVANAAARTLQGVSSARSGNVLGGIASIGCGIASGIGSVAGSATSGLAKAADNLDRYSTKLSAVAAGTQAARSYQVAGHAVGEARQALAAAQASGNSRAVAAAQAQLVQAERQQRTALFGAAAGALQGASLWVGDKGAFPDQARTGAAGAGIESRLQLASRAFSVARDVNSRDYLSAAVSGLGVAATVDARRHPLGSTLGDASRLAEAGLGYYRSDSGLDAARAVVDDAEARVRVARASGNPAALTQAETALREARRGLETATMGAIAAGESLLDTAAAVRSDRTARASLAEEQRLKEAALAEEQRVRDERAKDPKYQEALGRADASQIEGQRAHRLVEDWVGSASLPPEVREAAAAAAGAVFEAHSRLEDARKAGADADTLASLTAALDAASRSARGLHERIEQVLFNPDAPQVEGGLGAGGPAFASLRIEPDPHVVVEVTKGLTVWAVSMRTGIPVDRILEFNRENGNSIDPKKMAVGAKLLVPSAENEQTFVPKTEGESRSMQRAAVAQRRAHEQVGQALGIPGITGDEVTQLQGLLASFESRNQTAAVAELDKLLSSGSPRLQQFARAQIGGLEEDRLTSIQHLNTARISEIGAAVEEATETSAWSAVNPLTVVRVWSGHDDNLRAIGSERQVTIQDQQMGVGAVQQIRRTTGVTLHELAKMTPGEIDDVLRRANPQLDPSRVSAMRTQVLRSLGHPDVAAVARGSFDFGSFSWERGQAAADTSFATPLMAPATKVLVAGAHSLGEGLQHLRAGAEAAKSSSSFYESYSGHFVATTLDYTSSVSGFTETVEYARQYWTGQGGMTGWVGDKLAAAGGLVASPVTSTAKLFDYKATDAERTGAMVEVGLMLATLGASRAGVGSLAARAVSREAAAFAQTRVGAAIGTALSPAAQAAARMAAAGGRVLTTSIDDLARGAGAFTLRQSTRAADALGATAAGRSLQFANQKVLSPLAGATTRGAAALNRSVDAAVDYFQWANRFGQGPVMTTGARIIEKTGLVDLQAKHAAAKAYDAIRNSTDDVARIAKTRGRSEADIAQIKQHLFRERHELADGLRRFDADPKVADAWARLQGGSHTADDLALLQHEIEESMLMKAGMSHSAAHGVANRSSVPEERVFVGQLRGESIELRGVEIRTLDYAKRTSDQLAELRADFNSSVRKLFLKDLANDPTKVPILARAGLSKTDMELMARGVCPDGWQVHHKIPLDDGGTNAVENLVLSKYDPYHKVLTNHQNAVTRGLRHGEVRVVEFPIPIGFVYPLSTS